MMKQTLLNRSIRATFALGLLTSVASAQVITDLSKPVIMTEKDSVLIVELPANPTTGYRWVLDGQQPNLLVLPQSHHYQASSNGKVGAGGIDRWTFSLSPQAFLVPTYVSIKLNYMRPWDSTVAKHQIINVMTVDKDS